MKKGLVLILVIGVMFVLTILAVAALSLMTTESRVAEHKIRRTSAYYAAQAGIVDGLERLRRNLVALPTAGNPTTYSLGTAVNGYTPTIIILMRPDTATINARNYTCPASAPSPYCVFSAVENYGS